MSSGFNPQTGLSTGYDFLTDSAEATRDLMDAQGLTTDDTLINETWTAADLKSAWTGAGATRQDLASISAHFEHWHAIPPNESAGLFASTDISNAATSPISTVVWSVGCHAGYSVHDEHSQPGTELDFAQAFAKRQTGGFVANTGYGLGDTTEIAYSERLMLYFAQELGRDEDIAVGEALMRAKQRYVGSASSGGFSRYDEKVMIEATLYGLPMYRVTVPITTPVPGGLGSGGGGHMVKLGGALADTYTEITFNFEFTPHATGAGVYYTVQSNYGYTDTQTSAGRPIQPLVISDVTRSGLPARGVVVVGARYYTTTIDPVITTLVTDTSKSEPLFDYEGWYPTNIAVINRLGSNDNLVIVPAQFHSESGVERLYTELTLRVYYTDTGDYMPPSIWSVESTGMGGTAFFQVDVSDDESGVAQVQVMYENRSGEWMSFALDYAANTGLWEGAINSSLDELHYLIQAVDNAGNVSYSSNKGFYFAAEPEKIYLPLVFRGASR